MLVTSCTNHIKAPRQGKWNIIVQYEDYEESYTYCNIETIEYEDCTYYVITHDASKHTIKFPVDSVKHIRLISLEKVD